MTRPLILLCILLALVAVIAWATDRGEFYTFWGQAYDGGSINDPNNH